jgi:hypothetical protein
VPVVVVPVVVVPVVVVPVVVVPVVVVPVVVVPVVVRFGRPVGDANESCGSRLSTCQSWSVSPFREGRGVESRVGTVALPAARGVGERPNPLQLMKAHRVPIHATQTDFVGPQAMKWRKKHGKSG